MKMCKMAITSLVLGLTLIGSAGHAQGLTYEFVSTTSADQNGQKKEVATMRGKAAVLNDKARVEIKEMSAAASVGAGSDMFSDMYLLVLDNGNRFVWVQPSKKSYYESNTGELFAGMNAMVGSMGSMMQMKASNVNMNLEKVGAGPSILGHSTVHYRITQSWDMTMKIFGKSMKSGNESIADTYFAPSIKVPSNPFLSSNAQMGNLLGEEFSQKMTSLNAQLENSGLPLKMVTQSKTTDDDGKVTVANSVMEIQNLTQGPIDASTFAIPSGYTKMEPPKGVPGLTDKAAGTATETGKGIGDAAKDGAKEGAKETVDETKQDVKNKAKKAVRGLFGKP